MTRLASALQARGGQVYLHLLYNHRHERGAILMTYFYIMPLREIIIWSLSFIAIRPLKLTDITDVL